MTDKLRAAAKAALEWLRDERLNTWMYMDSQFYDDRDKQAEALEAALAEPAIKESLTVQRPWVGLTDDEINLIYDRPHIYFTQYAKDIEAKLREKNT